MTEVLHSWPSVIYFPSHQHSLPAAHDSHDSEKCLPSAPNDLNHPRTLLSQNGISATCSKVIFLEI